MSLFGSRESNDDTMLGDMLSSGGASYLGESNCQRFWMRLMTCLRESQELDVLYDCRSRMLDMRECVVRPKQSTWALRETLLTTRKETALRKWVADYEERMGHPPLLEAVSTIRKKVEAEGGLDILNPTVFKDPDPFIPKSSLRPPQSTQSI